MVCMGTMGLEALVIKADVHGTFVGHTDDKVGHCRSTGIFSA